MTDMNESGKKGKAPLLPEEEEIIELTDILAEAIADEDDDIIDLTEILEEPQSHEEDIIELIDIVPEKPIQSEAVPKKPEEDEIIDLAAFEKELQTDEDEDEIIELLDAVEEPDESLTKIDEAMAATQIFEAEKAVEPIMVMDQGIEADDDIIMLTEEITEETDTLEPARPAPSAKPIPIELEDSIGITFADSAALEDSESKAAAEKPPEIDEELIELIESAEGKDLNALLDDVSEESALESETEDEEAVDLEGDLLEVDATPELSEEEIAGDEFEKSDTFADSLGVDLVSALTPTGKTPETDMEKIPEKQPGKLSVHVQNKREEGGPIDFKFESRLHPGEEIYREQYLVPEPPAVSQADFEKALEKVVREMFAENIERMLTDIVQKVVSEEIRKIKKALLEE